jgi:hypothetical protein
MAKAAQLADFARPIETIVADGPLTVTPILAERILVERNYERQRPLDNNATRLWTLMLKEGRFVDRHQIWFGRLNGRLHLIDGQHRLAAVLASGVSAEFQAVILEVDTAEDLHTSYSLFDRVGRKRTLSEVFHARGIMDTHKLTVSAAKACFAASLLLEFDFKPPHHSQDPLSVRDDYTRERFAAPWWGLMRDYEAIVKTASTILRRRLLSPQVTAVALLTLRDQPEQAEVFWKAVALNDGLRRGDPRHTLVCWLLESANSGNQGGAHWQNLDTCKAVSLCWNAFYEHRTLEVVKIGNMRTTRFAGTSLAKGV